MSGAPLAVGVIGVGNMGAAMAARLCELGWRPWVSDLVPSRVQALECFGAVPLVDIAQYAMNSVATVICVVDAGQTREVLFGKGGLARELQPGHVVVLCPTIAPDDVQSISQELALKGIDAIAAPMSGGPARARLGTMSLMLAGAAPVMRRCKSLLDALSSQQFYLGERLGDGAKTKLVNNLLAGINLVGAAEALALAQHLGLDLGATLDVIEQSSGQSWIGTERMRRAIVGDLAPRAHMTLLGKDTRLALEAAAAVGFAGPLGSHASAVFANAVGSGCADEDDAALLGFLARPKMGQ